MKIDSIIQQLQEDTLQCDSCNKHIGQHDEWLLNARSPKTRVLCLNCSTIRNAFEDEGLEVN